MSQTQLRGLLDQKNMLEKARKKEKDMYIYVCTWKEGEGRRERHTHRERESEEDLLTKIKLSGNLATIESIWCSLT